MYTVYIQKVHKYINSTDTAFVLREEISEMPRVEYDCFVTEVCNEFASRQFTLGNANSIHRVA